MDLQMTTLGPPKEAKGFPRAPPKDLHWTPQGRSGESGGVRGGSLGGAWAPWQVAWGSLDALLTPGTGISGTGPCEDPGRSLTPGAGISGTGSRDGPGPSERITKFMGPFWSIAQNPD